MQALLLCLRYHAGDGLLGGFAGKSTAHDLRRVWLTNSLARDIINLSVFAAGGRVLRQKLEGEWI